MNDTLHHPRFGGAVFSDQQERKHQPQPSCDEAWLSGLSAGKGWKSGSRLMAVRWGWGARWNPTGRGGISLPAFMSFPVSRVGLLPAVKPKGVTFIGEIKGHAIRGVSQQGSQPLFSNHRAGVEGLSLAKILQLVTDRTEYVNLTP